MAGLTGKRVVVDYGGAKCPGVILDAKQRYGRVDLLIRFDGGADVWVSKARCTIEGDQPASSSTTGGAA